MTLRGSAGPIINLLEDFIKRRQFINFLSEPYQKSAENMGQKEKYL